MVQKTTMTISGLNEVLKNLDKASNRMLRDVKAWFFDELIGIFNLSQEFVPVASGALRASGVLEPIKQVMPIGFVGIIRYTQAYAFEQHEIPFPHKIGRWKYLSSAVEERSQGMIDRGVRKIRL